MTKKLHKADFDPHKDTIFKVHSDEHGTQELTLFEIDEAHYVGQESFSLFFKGPKEPIMRQMNYPISHPEMGDFRLFLVPVKDIKTRSIIYQSVFSRPLEEKE